MSTIICDDCGRQYNSTHPSCPACGTETVEARSTKHTPEPWCVHNTVTIHGPNGNDYGILAEANIYRTESDGAETGQANAARIVACVNACAGMEDPAEALRLARAALKRAAYSLKVHGAKDVDVQCAEALRALGGT